MDLDDIGIGIFFVLLFSLCIVVIMCCIKYIKEPTIRHIQDSYILYDGHIYKELDVENIEELLGE